MHQHNSDFVHEDVPSQQPVTHSPNETVSESSLPKEHHTVDEVATWLANIGYIDAALLSRSEKIDGEAFTYLSVQDLRSLGLKWGFATKVVACVQKNRADRMGEVSSNVQSSLTLGAERTLYAAQQMGWNVMFVGMGLMMATMDDDVPNTCGMVSIICGIVFIVASWLLHVKRLRDFSMHRQTSLVSSGVFTLGCTLLFVIAVSTELYFGAIYPYLLRTKQVEINN
mmetsp:Transcript_117580/g.228571  ORF Transcript_117580/g.228571 Transcript_117580/m.228571 type:complete len:226 (+) Transcript_117580:261-938(+)